MKRLILIALVFSIGVCFGNNYIIAQEANPPNTTSNTPSTNKFTAKLSGDVVWEGFDLSQTNVSVYRDEKLKNLYTSGLSLDATGTFSLRVEPGTYYLVAYVDVDRSGRFDEGDGYGVFGIQDWQDKTQKHRSVTVEDAGSVKAIKISITARLQAIGNEQKMVPANLYQPSEYKQFKSELTRATSGCRGFIIDDNKQQLSHYKRLILAYTDTSWKYRAGIAEVDPKTGEWELRLQPGKYYLMAIVDKNASNKLDTGDTFGFYGVKDINRRGAFPEPVLIKPATFTENLAIRITATYSEKNLLANKKKSAIISGRVIPIPDDEIKTRVEVYPTSVLVNPIASSTADSEGTFTFQLPVGEYYFIANQDTDGDGRYSKNDYLGGYGTMSIATKPPVPLRVVEGETRAVYIYLSARYDSNGQLIAMSEDDSPPTINGLALNPSDGNVADDETGRITGKITSFFSTSQANDTNKEPTDEAVERSPDGLLSLSKTPDFSNPVWMPLFLEEDGTFIVDVKPGQYYVMAVVDQNKDGKSGTSDGIGLYGTHQPVRGTPATITVFPGKTTPHVDIDIMATYVDEKGTMAELSDGGKWNIARMYGEPDDIFKYTKNGKLVEEWMYWTRGLGFYFVADGVGWKLSDKKEFQTRDQNSESDEDAPSDSEPKEEAPKRTEPDIDMSSKDFSLISESVFIYYSHEGVLWRIAPTTNIKGIVDSETKEKITIELDTRVAPIGAGFHPSASKNGMLVYHDFEDNVILRDIASGESIQLLDNRQLAKDVVISPNGEYIAYTQLDPSRRKRILIQHLRSEETFLIPSSSLEMSSPAWRKDGKMLAFSSSGSIENPSSDKNRNIFAFDQETRSLQPVVISAADDAEPAWHPSNLNTIAFSRGTSDDLRQIWVITYTSSGKPTEIQITEMGGSRPVWVPPNGRWIIYENNGQLWTVDTQTPGSESPMMSNGQVVFGYQPVAISVK